MSWGLPVRNGLSVGIGSVVSLASGTGRSRRIPTDGSPTLILDFVPGTGVGDYTLDLSFSGSLAEYAATGSLGINFTAQTYSASTAPEPAYSAYVRDPSAPDAFINIQVWN